MSKPAESQPRLIYAIEGQVDALCKAIEILRAALEQAVDDFGDGHCVCEATKQMCINALKE